MNVYLLPLITKSAAGISYKNWLPESYEMDCIFKGLKEHVGLLFYMVKYN
ncbi:MAG TPA: hypothetical protein PK358_16950 [Spirochaetota bacterium]|nr:hypothetical protein [Spirochaetota bacterium]HPJ36529.1 hypothetical protein [Spirochaetota bacterium]